MKRIKQKLLFIGNILKIHQSLAILLFAIILLSAVTEFLGLGLIMPFLEIATGQGSINEGTVQYLAPILRLFAENQHLAVIGIMAITLIILKNILSILRIGFTNYFGYRYRIFWRNTIMKKYMYAEYPFIIAHKQGGNTSYMPK